MKMLAKFLVSAALVTIPAAATDFTFVPIPGNNNIQTSLISTFPTGIFSANNSLGTPFAISGAPGACGTSQNAPCNFFDAFGTTGPGTSITMNVSIDSPTDVYTLINAYDPAGGQQLATIQFVGTGGVSVTFPLVGGLNIRDFYQGEFTNTIANGVPGVNAVNAFTCNNPLTCLGSGGTGDVQTGDQGYYVVDEQDFSLGSAFVGQTLTQIILTDTYGGSTPILLGVTVAAASPASSVATVNAASFSLGETVAPDSIASVFGSDIATQNATAAATLGDALGGTSMTITDAFGTLSIPLFFVSPGQANVQIPAGLASGTAVVQVTSGDGVVSSGAVTITSVAPGIFNVDNLALAYSLQNINDALQYTLTVQPDPNNTGKFVPAPIVLSSTTDTYLVLFGTGIRNAAISDVTVQIGDLLLTPTYAGPTGDFAGEDQVNVLIPASLAGSGDNQVIVTANGEQANIVHVTIQ